MATPVTGLQTDRFKQSFATVNNPGEVYTTETYVNDTINGYLNTNSTVNITLGDGVSIIDTVTGSTFTTVTVGLSASLGALDDVNVAGVPANQYLQWNGTCWSYGPGASINDLAITNLNGYIGGVWPENSILFAYSSTSFNFKEDKSIGIDYLTTPSLNGLRIVKNSSYPYQASVETDFSTFNEDNNADSPDNTFVIVTSDGTTVRIKKEDIGVSTFQGFTGSVVNVLEDNLSVTNINNDSLHSSGLSLAGTTINLNLSNYLSGAGGLLPISRGGTSAGSSSQARINLGLSYNSYGTCYDYDIMGYSRPEFREGMLGDNIRLVPGISSVTITATGSGYNPGLPYTVTTGGISLGVSVLTGATGTGLTSVTFTDPIGGFPYIYEDFTAEVSGHTASGGSIGVCVTPVYINFGQYTGATGYGFRGNHGTMEVKNRSGAWEEINNLSVSQLSDTSITGLTAGNFLIYSGASFVNYSITGDINISSTGVASITTGGISISQINFGTPAPGISDFQNLTGTTGNIQQQLDEKLYTSTPINVNRQILVLNGESLTGTSASVLTFNSSDSGDAPNCNQFPMIEPSNHYGVSFQNLYQGFTGTTLSSNSATVCASVCLYEETREVVTHMEAHEFIEFTLETGGGLALGSNNKSQLAIETLPDYGTTLTYDDFIGIGLSSPPSVQPNKKIHIRDLLAIPSYTLPVAADNYFTGAAAFISDSGTNYFGIATGNGTSWYVTELTDII